MVFNKAKTFLQGKCTTAFNACVVLDEIGLAEDSPQMPLKVLHEKLEQPDVGFIGLR